MTLYEVMNILKMYVHVKIDGMYDWILNSQAYARNGRVNHFG